MNATLGFGLWNPLYPVNAAFELEPAVGPLAMHHEDDLFEATKLGRRLAEKLRAPSLLLGVPGVHAEQIGRKVGRLIAPGPCPDLDDDILLIGRILRQ